MRLNPSSFTYQRGNMGQVIIYVLPGFTCCELGGTTEVTFVKCLAHDRHSVSLSSLYLSFKKKKKKKI